MLYRGVAGFSSVPREVGLWDVNRDEGRELTVPARLFRRSLLPIDVAQPRHTAEFLGVVRYEGQIVDKSDGGDLQIRDAIGVPCTSSW